MIRPLYKAVEPFMEVERGHGYQGVVMYDDVEDKVQCHICGKYFASLGRHVGWAHDMNADEYKMEYGLSLRTALCSKEVSTRRSMTSKQAYDDGKMKLSSYHPGKRRKQRQGSGRSMQSRNTYGLCDLQIRGRYDVVKNIVGRIPTRTDFEKHDRKLLGAMLGRHGTINKFRKHMGDKPLPRGLAKTLPNTVLIAALRAHAKKHHAVPRADDFIHGKPSRKTFYRHFGSWSNALRMAGIK